MEEARAGDKENRGKQGKRKREDLGKQLARENIRRKRERDNSPNGAIFGVSSA